MAHLYRHFDSAGQLLYVGISLSAIARLTQHRASSWAAQIARVEIESFATREEAAAAERAAIRAENPLHNIVHRVRNEARIKPGASLGGWKVEREGRFVRATSPSGEMVVLNDAAKATTTLAMLRRFGAPTGVIIACGRPQ